MTTLASPLFILIANVSTMEDQFLLLDLAYIESKSKLELVRYLYMTISALGLIKGNGLPQIGDVHLTDQYAVAQRRMSLQVIDNTVYIIKRAVESIARKDAIQLIGLNNENPILAFDESHSDEELEYEISRHITLCWAAIIGIYPVRTQMDPSDFDNEDHTLNFQRLWRLLTHIQLIAGKLWERKINSWR